MPGGPTRIAEITLRADLADGGEEQLQIQVYGAANNLRQAGVTDELFEIGDRITVIGRRSTRRPGLVLGTHLLLGDGRQAILSRALEPYGSRDVVGGLDAFPGECFRTCRCSGRKSRLLQGLEHHTR